LFVGCVVGHRTGLFTAVEKAAFDHSAMAADRCLPNSLLPKPNWKNTDAVTSKPAHAKNRS
jgi:hypothetical protein